NPNGLTPNPGRLAQKEKQEPCIYQKRKSAVIHTSLAAVARLATAFNDMAWQWIPWYTAVWCWIILLPRKEAKKSRKMD
ncbi:MAG: hypothetical protein RBU29_09320, partial [bacterium]|nr:hypothetical protein [bacterium]